ncbi:MAG: aminoglycoside phosphotransferase family protein [Anaerolineae bacterium]
MDLTIDTWDAWCRLYDQVEVWFPLVEAIARRHGLPLDAVRAGEHGSNAVFVVDECYVVKISAPFFREDYARELEVYKLLAQDDALPTPRVVADGVLEGSQAWPYMVLSYVPGARLVEVWRTIPREQQLALARQFGGLVARLHALPIEGIRTMDTRPEAWEAFVQSQTHAAPARFAEQGVPQTLLACLPAYLERIAPLYPAGFRPCLLSSDLTEDHLLLVEAEGTWRIGGLIDFGDAQIGHADYDFVCVHMACFGGDKALLAAFLGGYGYERDARFAERMLGYTLLHRFADMRPEGWILASLGEDRTVPDWETLAWRLWGE